MKHINIEQFSNGELTQQINREMEAVARNIADPNTEAKTARKITVTITMKPNEQGFYYDQHLPIDLLGQFSV